MDLYKLASIFCSAAGWGEWVPHGEWWIDDSGYASFADIDIGEQGHESIAVDYLLDKDVLIERLELGDEYKSDEYGASSIYFNENIPDDVGIEAIGGVERWNDLKRDERLAYMKHGRAIHVVGLNFGVWVLDDNSIRRIQDFISEEFEDQLRPDHEIWIEEHSKGGQFSMPVGEFLEIKHRRDFDAQLSQPQQLELFQKMT
jgi:hypothetical protein